MRCETCGFEGADLLVCPMCSGRMADPYTPDPLYQVRSKGKMMGPGAVAAYDQAKAEAQDLLKNARCFFVLGEVYDEEEEEVGMKAAICLGAGSEEALPTNAYAMLTHAVTCAVTALANIGAEMIAERKERGL